METLHISSLAFTHGEAIPDRYICDGTDTSTPLVVNETQAVAQTLARAEIA